MPYDGLGVGANEKGGRRRPVRAYNDQIAAPFLRLLQDLMIHGAKTHGGRNTLWRITGFRSGGRKIMLDGGANLSLEVAEGGHQVRLYVDESKVATTDVSELARHLDRLQEQPSSVRSTGMRIFLNMGNAHLF